MSEVERKLIASRGCSIAFGGKKTMSRFNTQTLAAMRAALAEVCRHIPQHPPDARAFVASKILESAYQGEKTYDGLLQVGRRAVIERFGSVNVVESALR